MDDEKKFEMLVSLKLIKKRKKLNMDKYYENKHIILERKNNVITLKNAEVFIY